MSNVVNGQQISNIRQILAMDEIHPPLIAVYCGSRLGNHDIYQQMAFQLGCEIANAGFGLVYGGACIGLMGAVADGVLSKNGVAVGVIPQFLLDKEVAHTGLTRLHLTDTMHTRKAIIAEYAAGFVTLAGGLGTLEEIMEIATWRQLYQHQKPIVLLNHHHFYDTLMAHLQHTVAQGFMNSEDLARLKVCENVQQVVQYLVSVIDRSKC